MNALIKSIKNFGYLNEVPPIVYDHIKKEVFMGIHRLEACRTWSTTTYCRSPGKKIQIR